MLQSKKLSKKLKKLRLSISIFLIGLLIFIFGATNYFRVRRLSFKETPQSALSSTQNIDVPIEIIIPSINIDLPVDTGEIKNGVWQISDKSATFLNISLAPGEGGNTVIYGHNKKTVFGNLPYLSIGQKISIKVKSGKIFTYEVKDKYFVGPERVDLVSPNTNNEITIYTCWGLFDSQRVVVKAKSI